MTDIVDLTDQIAALEATLSGTVGMVSAFEGELSKMQDSLVFTGREVGSPPMSGKLSAALHFLYFLGGWDRTMTWDIHRNARRLC